MRSERDLKLECLRLSSMLAAGKSIPPGQVVSQAMEYFRWVNGREELARDGDVGRLVNHYQKAARV